MIYTVKEIFKTLQGEGQHTGRPALFVRFAGCNLACHWCDTDFIGGTKFDREQLLAEMQTIWRLNQPQGRFCVLTGGEPLLQLDDGLIDALLKAHWRIAVETNGTIKAPKRIMHLTVSPKADAPVEQHQADELKFVYPQDGMTPEDAIKEVAAPLNYLQPMDGPNKAENTKAAIEYCFEYPWWRLSLQTHKLLGLR